MAIPMRIAPIGVMRRATGRSERTNGQVTKASVPLRGPVPRTTRISGVSAPRAASRIVRELAGAGCVLVLHGYGCTHRARAGDVTSEPD